MEIRPQGKSRPRGEAAELPLLGVDDRCDFAGSEGLGAANAGGVGCHTPGRSSGNRPDHGQPKASMPLTGEGPLRRAFPSGVRWEG